MWGVAPSIADGWTLQAQSQCLQAQGRLFLRNGFRSMLDRPSPISVSVWCRIRVTQTAWRQVWVPVLFCSVNLCAVMLLYFAFERMRENVVARVRKCLLVQVPLPNKKKKKTPEDTKACWFPGKWFLWRSGALFSSAWLDCLQLQHLYSNYCIAIIAIDLYCTVHIYTQYCTVPYNRSKQSTDP